MQSSNSIAADDEGSNEDDGFLEPNQAARIDAIVIEDEFVSVVTMIGPLITTRRTTF